ncbi:DUF5655 domain-containing protein [Streptacidiphilus sp. MAP5-52]|uniref:DUF5655 domain-containing protein n=1 Tax=Streptacidiphilus sp. MAP5-52 TaxID=3156267 RepID=UPI00351959F8
MEQLLGIRFLASEYYTGAVHSGRIDSLGIDEDGSPTVVEFKRARSENALTQGLFYLAWLRDHRAEFEAIVVERLGAEAAATVDWSSPRVICVAADFSRYDVHAVREIGRRVDLVRYTSFDGLLALETVASVAGGPGAVARGDDGRGGGSTSGRSGATVMEVLERAPTALRDLFADLDGRLLALGDVHSVPLRQYVAYRRSQNFACVKILPREQMLMVFLKVDPATVDLVPGWTRDVTDIGHHGTGNLEVRIRTVDDLARAADLFDRSYAA